MSAKRTRKAPQLVDVKDAPSEALARLRMGDAAAALNLLRDGGALGPELGAELAALAEKAIKRPKGRPPLTARQRMERAALARFLRWNIGEMTSQNSTPYFEAKAKWATLLHLTDGQLNHLLHPEGRVGEIAREMSLYDCYIMLPWLREFVNEVHATVTQAASVAGVTVPEFLDSLAGSGRLPPTK